MEKEIQLCSDCDNGLVWNGIEWEVCPTCKGTGMKPVEYHEKGYIKWLLRLLLVSAIFAGVIMFTKCKHKRESFKECTEKRWKDNLPDSVKWDILCKCDPKLCR